MRSEWVKKLWGKTKNLFRDDRSGFHIINIEKFGYSSQHYHSNLTNAFYIVEGKLEIVVYPDNEKEYSVILNKDEYLEVPPNVWHRFINHEENTVCLEIYWTPPHSSDNIDRCSIDSGGEDFRKSLHDLRKNLCL